ncbi:MAG: sodium:proton antiporter [Actinobacteria bacterium]|nr:sodium:proton antiporter [Actinomycetota bacterium]
MQISPTWMLALVLLQVLASGVFYVARRTGAPYTVLLVLVGLLLVPALKLPPLAAAFGFIDDLRLTPDLLFLVFLPVLIFESGYHMDARKLRDNAWSIGVLSTVGLAVSTAIIAVGAHFALRLAGVEVPLIATLLFGAIISATDPVAVLALFKEVGAPRRLTMIFEGESLFNDGTAVALFLVLMSIATAGSVTTTRVVSGVVVLLSMVLVGAVFGLAIAGSFAAALRKTRNNAFVSATLLAVSAHVTFISVELIDGSSNGWLTIHASPIIATTVAALFLGNYARINLLPDAEEYVHRFIEHVAFIANSLVFLLAGLLFASLNVDYAGLALPMLLTVFVVAGARALSVYAVTVPLTRLGVEGGIPAAWSRLLAWGSLRGALAIVVVLLIPTDFAIPGWRLADSPRDLLIALTMSCILATLFIKAPLIRPLMRRHGLDGLEPLDAVHHADLSLYHLRGERDEIDRMAETDVMTAGQHAELLKRLDEAEAGVLARREELVRTHPDVDSRALELLSLKIAMTAAKTLYANHELTAGAHRDIVNRVAFRRHVVEEGASSEPILGRASYRHDPIHQLVNVAHRFVRAGRPPTPSLVDRFEKHRGKAVVSEQVIATLEAMQAEVTPPVFAPDQVDALVDRYREECDRHGHAMQALLAAHPDEVGVLTDELALRALHAAGRPARSFLSSIGAAESMILASIAAEDGTDTPPAKPSRWHRR